MVTAERVHQSRVGLLRKIPVIQRTPLDFLVPAHVHRYLLRCSR